ncbi:hypothetical protein K461DRAFT_290581 [Myriangium duriaei CBS 260.36]|uniref:Extracellular membrane protein CFEM domain-containing protein n=1 Tax=Myriangium duriaei CBS 260.36 TaxID=1168546 RepID=A0A9P4MQF1_9PEZI|nr:hypothetical protein K461DRAFT_290581 [Myriangium duriaei CBS 260.36]
MRFSVALIAAATAGMAAAQSSTACAAQAVLDACLGSTNGQVQACAANDYTCLCYAYQAVKTCYNNCPNDPRAPSAGNQVTQFCIAASQYSTTNTPAASASSTSGSAATTTGSAASSSTSASAAGSSFGSGSSSTSASKGAGAMATPAAGALAMIFGAAALL